MEKLKLISGSAVHDNFKTHAGQMLPAWNDFDLKALEEKIKATSSNLEDRVLFSEVIDHNDEWIQHQVLYAFLGGKLSASSLNGASAHPLTVSESNDFDFTYLEGPFLNSFEGKLFFGDISPEVTDYGEFTFHLGFADIPPHWEFKLANSNEIESLIPPGKGVVIDIPYERKKSWTTTKVVKIFISHSLEGEILLSGESEGRFYRSVSKGMLTQARDFLQRNLIHVNSVYKHSLTEEIIYYFAWLSGHRGYSITVPHDEADFKNEVLGTFGRYTAQLSFAKSDIEEFIKELKKHGDPTPEAEVYIFRPMKKGGWEIAFLSTSHEINKDVGCFYIHKLISTGEQFDVVALKKTRDVIADEGVNSSSIQKYTSSEKRLSRKAIKNRLEQIESEIASTKLGNPEKYFEALDVLGEEKADLEKELERLSIGVELSNNQRKAINDSVNKAIKRALLRIAKLNQELGKHLFDAVKNLEVVEIDQITGRPVRRKMWGYRPKNKPNWITE